MIKTADPEEDQLKLRNTVSAANLTHSVKEIDIPSVRDKNGAVNMMASPVFPVNPNVNPMTNWMPCIAVLNDAQGGIVHPFSNAGDNLVAFGFIATNSVMYYTAGDGTGIVIAARTPVVYKNVQTAANGSTAIWTAGVGKRWRLMGVVITLGEGTTAAAGCKVSLLDVAADTGIGVTISTGALAAVPGSVIVLAMDIKNGILAAATNTALNVNLSSAMAVNGVSVQVWGTEE